MVHTSLAPDLPCANTHLQCQCGSRSENRESVPIRFVWSAPSFRSHALRGFRGGMTSVYLPVITVSFLLEHTYKTEWTIVAKSTIPLPSAQRGSPIEPRALAAFYSAA